MSRSAQHDGVTDTSASTGMDMPASGDAASTSDTPAADASAAYQATFRDAPYYSTGREWSDYAPAYRLGHSACSREKCTRFEDIEPALEQEWRHARAPSRLSWAEARGACEHAWRDCRSLEGAHVHEIAAATPGRHGG